MKNRISVMAFAVVAWAYCIFFFQGYSQDLFAGSGIRRHASFIINAQRGAEKHLKLMSQQQTAKYYERENSNLS